MPCMEPTITEETHNGAIIHFLTQALCHLLKGASRDAIESFPGLSEWKRRHDIIDTAVDKYKSQQSYDESTRTDPRSPPLFLRHWRAGKC